MVSCSAVNVERYIRIFFLSLSIILLRALFLLAIGVRKAAKIFPWFFRFHSAGIPILLKSHRLVFSSSTTRKIWFTADLLSADLVQKKLTKVKEKAKMINTTFALKFTTPCKLASKCGVYHICFRFPPSLHFFAPYFAPSKFV